MPTLSEDDREFIRTVVENGHLKAMVVHRLEDHAPLEAKIDSTRQSVWMGGGILAAVTFLWNYIKFGNHSGN